MPISPELQRYVIEQNANRKLWEGHDSPENVAEMIQAEYTEFSVQIQECYITDDLTALALEIGDVLYLTARYRGNYGDLPSDLLMLERHVYEVCDQLGLDPDDCLDAKIQRNAYKYPDHIMSNGRPYQEAVIVCKESWSAMGGDVAWSKVWLDHLARVVE